jgi:glutathione S-transferase
MTPEEFTRALAESTGPLDDNPACRLLFKDRLSLADVAAWAALRSWAEEWGTYGFEDASVPRFLDDVDDTIRRLQEIRATLSCAHARP